MPLARRDFLKLSGFAGFAGTMPTLQGLAQTEPGAEARADYTIRIGTSLIELGPSQIISTTTYNGSSQDRCCVSRKVSGSWWTFTTIPTRQSNCIGTAR